MGRMLISDETISLGTPRDANSRLCSVELQFSLCVSDKCNMCNFLPHILERNIFIAVSMLSKKIYIYIE